LTGIHFWSIQEAGFSHLASLGARCSLRVSTPASFSSKLKSFAESTGCQRKDSAVDSQVLDKIAHDYFRLFVNRRAYTVQATRPDPETGRHYYYRPRAKGTDQPLALTHETIRKHLEGQLTIALYAINPTSQCCKWVAIDADYKDALEDLLKLNYYLSRDGVSGALEKSRRGGHLWVFFETQQPARSCRVYVYDLALRLGVPVKGNGLPEGIEIFPKHDSLKRGEFGNAIRGPLGVHRATNRRYWFYGADYELEKQMAYLAQLPKVSSCQLKALVAGKEGPPQPSAREARGEAVRKHSGNGSRHEFRILEHIGTKLRKVGRNYVTQCPSCAASGHDRGGDNLAVSIKEPQKYICWAGCTKEMIRAALGCPVSASQAA
jgi:TOTE conflict system, Archaeo-Eukaryotic Primase domain